MDVSNELLDRNRLFIEAWQRGAWEILDPIIAPEFQYLDGATGTVTVREAYGEDVRHGAQPTLKIDQIVVHQLGDVAIVSARSSASPGRYSRYVDTYVRTAGHWTCIHACVWPLGLVG